MRRIPANYTADGIFPTRCPRNKPRCYNGTYFCCDMITRTGKSGHCFGPVTVMCDAPPWNKKRKAKP